MSTRRTELEIEHLVLEGVRPADAHLIGEALEQELTRLVRERGAPGARAAAAADLPVSIDARTGESPAALGARLADAIYGRLER
jgi:hypothetical protein